MEKCEKIIGKYWKNVEITWKNMEMQRKYGNTQKNIEIHRKIWK